MNVSWLFYICFVYSSHPALVILSNGLEFRKRKQEIVDLYKPPTKDIVEVAYISSMFSFILSRLGFVCWYTIFLYTPFTNALYYSRRWEREYAFDLCKSYLCSFTRAIVSEMPLD